MTKAVQGGIQTGLVMDSPDINQTLLLVAALLGSLTQLIRLIFGALRSLVREYYEFRVWLRTVSRNARRLEGDTE